MTEERHRSVSSLSCNYGEGEKYSRGQDNLVPGWKYRSNLELVEKFPGQGVKVPPNLEGVYFDPPVLRVSIVPLGIQVTDHRNIPFLLNVCMCVCCLLSTSTLLSPSLISLCRCSIPYDSCRSFVVFDPSLFFV